MSYICFIRGFTPLVEKDKTEYECNVNISKKYSTCSTVILSTQAVCYERKSQVSVEV